jgi:hypothetical protein
MARRAAAMLKSGRQRAAFGEIGGRIYPNRPLCDAVWRSARSPRLSRPVLFPSLTGADIAAGLRHLGEPGEPTRQPTASTGPPMRKLIAFDEDTFDKLRQLTRDRMATFQELADEAFADLLKKHGIPIDLKDALRKSAGVSKPAPKTSRKASGAKP